MLFTAIIIGFAGSLHCLGMCSPLAMAVTRLRKPFIINRLFYNGGRIFVYGILGVFVSIFGSLFQFTAFQNIFSLSLGCLLILFGIIGISSVHVPFLTTGALKVTGLVKNLFSIFLQKKGLLSITCMGMLNGLLPCGLTYLALTYCLTLSDAWHGFLFMLIFGAGTLPVMLGLTSALQPLITRFDINFRRITRIVLIVLGGLLITRSLLFHLPYNGNTIAKENIVICR